MIIVYDVSGNITNAFMDENNNPSIVYALSLHVDEIPENKVLINAVMLDSLLKTGLYSIVGGQITKDGQPIIPTVDANRDQIKSAYQAMITRLEQIQSVSNPTNAQVVAAVQDEALYLERILKVLKTMVL